jgi:hypothetical protein
MSSSLGNGGGESWRGAKRQGRIWGRVGDAPNDIFILQFFEQRYFADGGTGHPFVFRFKPYLFQSDHLSRVDVLCLVYNPVCP